MGYKYFYRTARDPLTVHLKELPAFYIRTHVMGEKHNLSFECKDADNWYFIKSEIYEKENGPCRAFSEFLSGSSEEFFPLLAVGPENDKRKVLLMLRLAKELSLSVKSTYDLLTSQNVLCEFVSSIMDLPLSDKEALTHTVFDFPECPAWARYAAVDQDGTAYWYALYPEARIHRCKWARELDERRDQASLKIEGFFESGPVWYKTVVCRDRKVEELTLSQIGERLGIQVKLIPETEDLKEQKKHL